VSAVSFLRQFEGISNRTFPSLQDSKLKQVAQRLRDQFGFAVSDRPNIEDIKNVYHKLIKIFSQELDFTVLTTHEWKLVPWAFVQSFDELPILFEQDKTIITLFSWLQDKNRIEVCSPFIQVFLHEYPIKSSKFNELRESLLNYISNNQHQKLKEIKIWLEQTSILESNAAEIAVERTISDGFSTSFNTLKLINGLQFGQFTIVMLRRFFTRLSADFSSYDQAEKKKLLEQLLTFLIKDESLSYPLLRIDVADGLLQSFQSHSAKEYEKKKLKAFFLKYYGDPRTSKGAWVGISEEAVNVMKSWMVEDTMLDFFNLLSAVAKTDSTADKHWQYRKRFWNAYLKKGYIKEAWVALGPNARFLASQHLKGGASSYASLSGGDSKHSSLIMVIGDVLVTEWSHSGKFRIWQSIAKGPPLYKKAYSRDRLVNYSDFEGSHMSSDTGAWQYTLSSRLNYLTGLQVKNWEYMND
jgi:hypothetical protein